MTISLKHNFQSAIAVDAKALARGEVTPDNWNAEHTLTQSTGKLLGRSSSGGGATEEISPSAAFTLAGLAFDLSDAGIALSKLAQGTDGQIIVGQTSSAPLYKTITGDFSITAAGVAAINPAISPTMTGNWIFDASSGVPIHIASSTGDATTTIQGDGASLWHVKAQSVANGNQFLLGTSVDEHIILDGNDKATLINGLYNVADLRFYGTSADVNAAVVAAIAAGFTKVLLPAGWTYVPPSWSFNTALYNAIPDGLTIIGENQETSIVASSDPTTKYLIIGAKSVLQNVSTREAFGYGTVTPVNTVKSVPVFYSANRSSLGIGTNPAQILTNYPGVVQVVVGSMTVDGVAFDDHNGFAVLNSTKGGAYFGAITTPGTGPCFDAATESQGNGVLMADGVTPFPDYCYIARNGYTNPSYNHYGFYLQEYGTHTGGRGVLLERQNGSTTPLLYFKDVGPTTYSKELEYKELNFLSGGIVSHTFQASTPFNGTFDLISAGNSGGTFTGDFVDYQIAGSSKFRVDYTGAVNAGIWNGTIINAAHGGTGINNGTNTLTLSAGLSLPGAALGDIWYGSSAGVMSALAGNTTTTKKYLSQTGTGSASAAPAFAQIAVADLSDGTTGSGAVARATSPAFTTPSLGVASATSLAATGKVQGQFLTATGAGSAPAVNGAVLSSETSWDVLQSYNLRGLALNPAGNPVFFPGISTTASAANAFIDNASNNSLLRSTSSIRYKRLKNEMLFDEAAKIIWEQRGWIYQSLAEADDDKRDFIGLVAEQVAERDDRFVHRDADGRPDGVMYDRFVVPLIVVVKHLLEERRGALPMRLLM